MTPQYESPSCKKSLYPSTTSRYDVRRLDRLAAAFAAFEAGEASATVPSLVSRLRIQLCYV